MRERIYLDYNATAPLEAEAREAITEALGLTGNPSSVHEEGREAREVVESARAEVAALVGAEPAEIVFTSGGTEADCLGVAGLARIARRSGLPARIAAPEIEHPAVRGALRALGREGFEVVAVPVHAGGAIDLAALRRVCAQGVGLVVVGHANHELGTLQDIEAVSAIAREAGALVHCDAVQSAGKLDVRAPALGADAVAVSAHKFGGPKGVGALWIAPERDLEPLFEAGHQERERRPGTENVPGIAGMGAAARRARKRLPAAAAEVAQLALRLEQGLRAMDGVEIHGGGAVRVGNTVNAGFTGALGESVVAALDLAGIAASTGAACTSGTVAPSPVLRALGLPPERAVEAVRFSLGPGTRADHIDETLSVLPPIVERARAYR